MSQSFFSAASQDFNKCSLWSARCSITMSILYRVTLLLLPEILVSASWSPTDSVAHDLRHPLEQDGKEGTTIRVPVRHQRPSSRRARSLLQLDRKESHLPTASRIFGTLFVGTPPQKLDVAFDTGSGNLSKSRPGAHSPAPKSEHHPVPVIIRDLA